MQYVIANRVYTSYEVDTLDVRISIVVSAERPDIANVKVDGYDYKVALPVDQPFVQRAMQYIVAHDDISRDIERMRTNEHVVFDPVHRYVLSKVKERIRAERERIDARKRQRLAAQHTLPNAGFHHEGGNRAQMVLGIKDGGCAW